MAPALGLLRLNERKQRPNPAINFIKPLEGPDHDTAHDFLSRIAAIAAPITRKYYINVMSLEEFPPNREFWGRNFNNGECIQLVLKSPKNGRWLPFRMVQMVFMHELAHVHQMNHGREFWKLQTTYAAELKALWAKNFTGEGLWGRGQALYSGQYSAEEGLPGAERDMVASTCGGTFRGFRGKRRRQDKPKLSYAEQKERRIKKKFGDGGKALGDDNETRLALEKGKKTKGKPRVACSNRGRELRAAAALARFDADEAKPEPEDEEDADDTDYGSDLDDSTAGPSAKGANGEELKDSQGHRLVRVCEGEDDDGEDARREMDELGTLGGGLSLNDRPVTPGSRGTPIPLDEADISTASEDECPDTTSSRTASSVSSTAGSKASALRKPLLESKIGLTRSAPAPAPASALNATPTQQRPITEADMEEECAKTSSAQCAVCSLKNDPQALTCAACSHVLHPDQLTNHWRCHSDVCRDSVYVNAGDVGLCGLCGSTRP